MASLEDIQAELSRRSGGGSSSSPVSPIEAEMSRRGLTTESAKAAAPQPTTFDDLDAENNSPITDPLPPPSPPPIFKGNPTEAVEEFDFVADPISTKAAAAGVEFRTPAPAGHALASFAFGPAEEKKAFERELEKEFGFAVPVRGGKESATGELEFFDPNTRRWTLVNSPETVSEDIKGFAGPAVTILLAATMGSLTALATRSPLLINAASSVGDFVGEISRILIGRQLGINQGVTDDQMLTQAAKLAGISFVAGSAMETFGRLFIAMASGQTIDKKLLSKLDIPIDEAADVAKQVNDRMGAQRLKFNLAQATNDPDLLLTQEFLKKSPQYQAEFGTFKTEQNAALDDFFKTINEPFESGLKNRGEVGEAVQDALRPGVERRVLDEQQLTEIAASELDQAVTRTASRSFNDFGVALRETASEAKVAFREWSDKAVKALNGAMGNTPFIPLRETSKAARQLNKEARDSVFPQQGAQKRSLVGAYGAEATDISKRQLDVATDRKKLAIERRQVALDKKANAIANSEDPNPFDEELLRLDREIVALDDQLIDLDVAGRAAVNKLLDPNTRLTFQESWDAISFLKRKERISGKGLSSEEAPLGSVKFLRKALEADMDKATSGSQASVLYDQFKVGYAQGKERLDKGVIGKIMTRDGANGPFKMTDEKAFRAVFVPKDKRAAEQVVSVIGSDPAAMRGMREAIVDFYKKSVMQDGRVNVRKHGQFIEEYRSVLPMYFKKNEMRFFIAAGKAEKALQAREAAQKAAVDRINKSFDGRLVNLDDPKKVISTVWDPDDPRKMRDLMTILEKTPDVKRAVQKEVLRTMNEAMRGQADRSQARALDFQKLNDFLNGKSGEKGKRELVKAAMGDRYMKDLNVLTKAMEVASRQTDLPNTSNTSFWSRVLTGLVRAQVGMFTRPGRVVTAINMIRGKASERVLFKAIMNPDDLHELIAMRNFDARTSKVTTLLGNMGGAAFLLGSDE